MKTQIPKIQLEILNRTLLTKAERFYSDPDNRARFEKWKQSEEGKAYIARAVA